ncbi:MAG: hypothetical protein Q7S37_03295 [bacterium]|nr:hypothetical protein [bacterium]
MGNTDLIVVIALIAAVTALVAVVMHIVLQRQAEAENKEEREDLIKVHGRQADLLYELAKKGKMPAEAWIAIYAVLSQDWDPDRRALLERRIKEMGLEGISDLLKALREAASGDTK